MQLVLHKSQTLSSPRVNLTSPSHCQIVMESDKNRRRGDIMNNRSQKLFFFRIKPYICVQIVVGWSYLHSFLLLSEQERTLCLLEQRNHEDLAPGQIIWQYSVKWQQKIALAARPATRIDNQAILSNSLCLQLSSGPSSAARRLTTTTNQWREGEHFVQFQ